MTGSRGWSARAWKRAAPGVALLLAAGAGRSASGTPAVPTLRPQVIAVHPHDPTAFTQGLSVHAGELIESTGLHGQSQLRAEDPVTGNVRTRAFLSPEYFGEGSTVWKDAIYMLTWREHTCFVYGLDFLRRGSFTYEGEGWGLTHDDAGLILSDGTTNLKFIDPETFKTVRTLHVTENGQDVLNLNELEYVRGRIWANVWQTRRIVEIDPATGAVVAAIDLSGLDSRADPGDGDAVANGIAFDAEHDRVYVTGKRWPRLFEIRLPR